jgi:hypothetical protein
VLNSTGGPIGSSSAVAASLATTMKYSAGAISSDAYTVLTTGKAFQVFGNNQTTGSVPLISIDPDGSSTKWTNNGNVQVVGLSFAAISTGVIYLDSNDIIIGNKDNGHTYFNGTLDIRNSTDISGSHQYIRNIWISAAGAEPAIGSSSTGFVGDLWVTY